MARVDVTRGLSELRRQLRKSRHGVRNYNGDTLLFIKVGGGSYGTPEQERAQALLKEAGSAWRALDNVSKAAWRKYGARHGKAMGDQKYKDFSGWDVFHPAFRNRALAGLPPAQVPVNSAPPPAVESAEEVASGDERTFKFRIRHGLNADGYMLLARITPGTISRARKPVSREMRLICGHTAGSIAPLPANGKTVTFTNALFGVAPGLRYGVELRVVRTADGVHSNPLFLDLFRKGTAA